VTHAKRDRSWGALAVSLAAIWAVLGCQDGYPIAPTACDRYCALGLAPECGDENPSACVVSCEATNFSHVCPSEFDDWVGCSRDHQRRLECGYSVVGKIDGCEKEQRAIAACATAHGFPVPSGTE